MSAFGGKADIIAGRHPKKLHRERAANADVKHCKTVKLHASKISCLGVTGHKQTFRHSFDHFIGEQQERLGRRETECLGRLEIDHEFKLDRRLHWQIARRFALENAINV